MILSKLLRNRGGFTLVEIMIVVAIIALLAAIAVPNFMRARKRSQATRIISDLKLIDEALDMYFMERDKPRMSFVLFDDVKPYFKQGTRLYNMPERDFTGNYIFSDATEDLRIRVGISTDTFNNLSDVAPVDFWSPYLVEGQTN